MNIGKYIYNMIVNIYLKKEIHAKILEKYFLIFNIFFWNLYIYIYKRIG